MVKSKVKSKKSKPQLKSQNLKIRIGRLTLKNPVIAASGTFGYGEEMKELFDINALGAIVTKTITLEPKKGNPTPRIVETPSGILNSIGLENKGLKDFIKNKVPFLQKLKAPIIVSIAAFSLDEFSRLAEELSKIRCVSAIELNLSCPNISQKSKVSAKGGSTFGGKSQKLIAQSKDALKKVVSHVRKKTKLTLITKLSPNVTDIKEIAKAAEDAGSDAISLINTIFGMSVDIDTKKSNLGSPYGGLSGPAIKPIALNFVREAYLAVKIPVIGIGGIMTKEDALEFIITGASAVQVGTANFVNPKVTIEIIDGIISYMKRNRIKKIKELVGSLK